MEICQADEPRRGAENKACATARKCVRRAQPQGIDFLIGTLQARRDVQAAAARTPCLQLHAQQPPCMHAGAVAVVSKFHLALGGKDEGTRHQPRYSLRALASNDQRSASKQHASSISYPVFVELYLRELATLH
eukprot:6211507-Pleurochrysis_carterae.AAC.2